MFLFRELIKAQSLWSNFKKQSFYGKLNTSITVNSTLIINFLINVRCYLKTLKFNQDALCSEKAMVCSYGYVFFF
jgi:hypothetical protein